jgi:hypothetical protein
MTRLLFNDHNRPQGKIYVLTGAVGYGKTSFVKYMGTVKLPQMISKQTGNPEKLLFVYYDVLSGRIQKEQALINIVTDFISRLKDALYLRKDSAFNGKYDFARNFTKLHGQIDPTNSDLENAIANATLNELVDFAYESKAYDTIFFVIDNIDECNIEVKQAADQFCSSLRDICQGKTGTVKTCILVPMREYTQKNHFFSTNHYFTKEMPPPKLREIVKKRLLAIKLHIAGKVGPVSHSIEIRVPNTSVEKRFTTRRITVTPQGAASFLSEVIGLIDTHEERHMREFLTNISNNNLKILIKTVYYLFHSCKLDYFPLFERVFDNGQQHSSGKPLFPIPLLIESLMSIHYPYFDKKSSIVINLFDCETLWRGDFRNTLAVPRVLYYLKNRNAAQAAEMYEDFSSISYDHATLVKALRVAFKAGLVMSDVGASPDDLSNFSTVRLSNAGSYYLSTIIGDVRYLHMVSEACPMPIDYIVPISEKYHYTYNQQSNQSIFRVNLKASKESVRRFVDFIQAEEEAEWSQIERLQKIDRDDFLARFGPHFEGSPMPIYSMLQIRTMRQWKGKGFNWNFASATSGGISSSTKDAR